VAADRQQAQFEDFGEPEEGEEGWLSRPDRQLAERIAQQVRHWMHAGFPLVKGGARRGNAPGDVMVAPRWCADGANLPG